LRGGGRCYSGNLSLSLSFGLSLSPFSSSLYALNDGTEAAKANAEKVRRGRARLFAHLCRDESKPPGDEIGEVSLRSGTVNLDPI